MNEETMYCTCPMCEGDFTDVNHKSVGGCGNEAHPKSPAFLCLECRDGMHIQSYRVFCETMIYARDEEQAAELGYQVLKETDYEVERMNNV